MLLRKIRLSGLKVLQHVSISIELDSIDLTWCLVFGSHQPISKSIFAIRNQLCKVIGVTLALNCSLGFLHFKKTINNLFWTLTSNSTPLDPCDHVYYFFEVCQPPPAHCLMAECGLPRPLETNENQAFRLPALTVRPLRTSCFATDHLPHCYFWAVGPHCSTLAKVAL